MTERTENMAGYSASFTSIRSVHGRLSWENQFLAVIRYNLSANLDFEFN